MLQQSCIHNPLLRQARPFPVSEEPHCLLPVLRNADAAKLTLHHPQSYLDILAYDSTPPAHLV